MGLDLALLLVGLIGAIDSLLALRLSHQPTKAAAACAIGTDGEAPACPTLFQSETAHLVGKTPNSLLGSAFFLGVLAIAICRLMPLALPPWVLSAALIGSLAATAMSLYLFWHLVFVRHERCVICFIGHACSLSAFVILALLVFR